LDITSKIVQPDALAITRAASYILQGELVGIPTETVYGLAADATNPVAVAKIFAAKGRPSQNPLIVHLYDKDWLSRVTAQPLPDALQWQVDKLVPFWPGPLTLVLPRCASIPDIVTAGRETVAVRVPAHPVTRQLLKVCDCPLAAPSANRSKYVSPTTAEHVAQGVGDDVAMILDGGPCEGGLESTIVLIEPAGATILRPGLISTQAIAAHLGTSLRHRMPSEACEALLAPGMMQEHYAPLTPLKFFTVDVLQSLPPEGRFGRIAFHALSDTEAKPFAIVEVLSEDCQLAQIAQKLFAAIRRLDSMGLDGIFVDTCELTGIGMAIMDRLHRAVAGHVPHRSASSKQSS
jgi:L-threonylcarbamoyladenylate synthase